MLYLMYKLVIFEASARNRVFNNVTSLHINISDKL